MEAAESTLLDFVEKVRGWIPRRADPSNISRDFWMPDRSCRVCYECESQFSLFNRRHHCRICGRVFCRRCTQNTIPVSGDGRKNDSAEDGERIKVCNFCFKLWKQEIAPQSNGFQLPPTPPPQAICPSPSATSLDSSSSSTVYPTGPYQHISSSSVAKSPQANGFEPLPGRKQEDILHSERNTSALSSVEGVSSPSLLAYCVSRSDDEGDEYSKDVEDAQEGLLRHPQEYFGEHASVDLHSGYILQNVCANNTNSQNSMNQAVQLHGLSSVENISEDVLSKSPSFQNDILVEQQMSCRSERSAEETEDTENFNDCNDDSVMFQSQNSEREQPFDFENNGAIWVPPEPEDVEDEIETSMIDEDDDDEDGSWGLAHSSGSFSSNEFKSKERSSEDHREAMRTVLDGHFRALVAQLLKGADVSVGEENYNESWLEIVTSLSWQAATFVKPDTSKGGGMDPGGYVKVKCIASGRRSDSKVIKGIVCSKNVKHKRMTQRYKNPRMLLLGGALEYQRVSNQLSSFETLLQQEMDHLKMTVARIEAHRPNVLLVEKTVSHHAQEYLLSKEISLVLNVKKKLLDRIARCTGAEIVPSLDNLAAPKVGHCELFHVDRFLEEHGCAGQSGKKQAKTLMFFEGCPRRLGCTVLLMGASRDQLKKVKHVVQYAVFAAYHLALETCFLADEGATLPELPLKSPITVALPDKQLSLDRSISMIPNSAVPIPEQNKGEMQNLKMYKAMSTVSALADDPLIDNNKGESKPPLTSGGMGPPMSHVTSKSSPDGTCLVQTEFVFKKSSIGDTCAQVTGVQWDPYPSGQRPSLPTTPSGDLSGLSASIKAYSNEIISPAGPGSYGAVMSYLELEDKESKDSDLANGFTVSVSSKVNLNHQITTEELSGKVAWENQGVAEKEMKSKVFPDGELLGYRNQEQVFSKEDFPPSPSDHQSILVMLSSRCVLKGTVCERSQLFRIKYYGSFDKPLGRYLRDDLFDQNSRCRFCNEPSEAHVLCYTHRQGSLTISVRQLPLLLTLPGEREGKIWMWHRCLKCARKDGVPEATRRVVMSDAAWGLSFGKFLELSFSNHAAASRVASCGHSLHRDCLRFYGFGSMIACFRYSSINVLSVHLPPSKLEFHDPHQQDWLKKEAAEVAEKVEMLFREVFNLLCQIGQKIATSGSFYSGIKVPESRRQIAELEGMLHKEIVEFEGLLQEAIISDGQDGRPVADISKLNSIRRLLLYEAYEWDRRLCHLDSSLRVKNSLAKLESSPLEDFKTPHKEYDSTINEKVGDSQGTVKDSNNSSGGFGIPMTEDTGSTVDGNCLDSAICSGNLQFKVIQAGDKHVLNNVNGQLSMTSNVDNSCLCDHLEGTGTVNGKLDEGMEIIKSAEGKTTQNLDDMEGGPDIRDSSSMTNGTMFHTFDMENGECDTSINVSETMPFETVDSRDNSNGLDEDLGTCRKLLEQDSPMLADLSDTLDAAWTGEGQSVKAQAVPATSQGQELGYVTLTTVASGSESADRKDFHPVQQIAIGDRMMSESTLNMQDKGGIEVPEKSIPPSPVKSLNLSEEFGSWIGAPMSNLPKSYSKSLQENLLGSIRVDSLRSYSPMFVSSVSHLGGNGVGKLLLPTGVNDMVIAVYDDEPTSIIAYALSSQEYQACLYDKAPDSEKQKEIDRDKEKECADFSGMGGVVSNPLWPSDGSLDLSKVLSKERSSGSEDIYTYGSKGNVGSDSSLYTKDTHAKISFRDEGPPRKVKYLVTCYYAKQFDALRKKCCPTEMDFRLSLSRCKKWGAQGGKSNVFFAKSLDERFIIKQVTRTELESFMKFASEYFKYLSDALSSGSPTCLAKILGIYQVTIKNAKGGKEIRMELMVMENLLFGRKVTRVYDLKGSGRSRYNADSSGNNKVLLDQNLLETMPTAPIFLGNKAKRLLERAVWNDTSFLASIDVMDYSLLVGVDEERCELVLGIIDFMRQYTWDKHLETWVKASGILGGPKNISPTVISPKQYKKRFRKAMSTYFLMVPDQWSPPAIIPCPLQIDKNEDCSSILTKEDSGDQAA